MGKQLKGRLPISPAEELQKKREEQHRRHEEELHEIELAAARKLLTQRLAEEKRRHDAACDAREQRYRERLGVYNSYRLAYNSHLAELGFSKGENCWVKEFKLEDGEVQTIKFAIIPILQKAQDIPKYLEGRPFRRVTWEAIISMHKWYLNRNNNYRQLGFVEDKTLVWTGLSFDGVYYFLEPRFCKQVWTWPGAAPDESLPHEPYSQGAVYEDRTIKQMDDLVLQRRSRHTTSDKLQSTLQRLPSVHLGDWKDHWDRQMRAFDPDPIEAYVPAPPAKQAPTFSESCPRRSKKYLGLEHSWTRHLRKLKDTAREARMHFWRDEYKRHFHTKVEKDEMCYDRRIFRDILDNANWVLRIARRRLVWLAMFQRCSFWSRETLQDPPNKGLTYVTFEVPGFLDGRKEVAFPDSGSTYNLLSMSYVILHKLDYHYNVHIIKLPNGTSAFTKGTVTLPWTFEDDPGTTHMIEFHILSNCAHDILFGNPFLDLTKLKTDNDHRIKQRQISEPYCPTTGLEKVVYDCHLAGSIINRMNGTLNGKRALVIPDSGCQVNAMSLATAKSLNLEVKYSGERGTFRFIDQSKEDSLGVVKLTWSPDHSDVNYELEFEIMQNCNGIILGQKHLYGNRAFVKHAACITQTGQEAMTLSGHLSTQAHMPPPNTPSVKKIPPDEEKGPQRIIAAKEDQDDGKVYGVTYKDSPLRRFRRRLLGKDNQETGASTQLSSDALDEMEKRDRIEGQIARIGDFEERKRLVGEELKRRKKMGDDDEGNGFLLGLLKMGAHSKDGEDDTSGEASNSSSRGGSSD